MSTSWMPIDPCPTNCINFRCFFVFRIVLVDCRFRCCVYLLVDFSACRNNERKLHYLFPGKEYKHFYKDLVRRSIICTNLSVPSETLQLLLNSWLKNEAIKKVLPLNWKQCQRPFYCLKSLQNCKEASENTLLFFEFKRKLVTILN